MLKRVLALLLLNAVFQLPLRAAVSPHSLPQALQHWAFRPLLRPPVSLDLSALSATSPLDALVRAPLLVQGLDLSPRAEAAVILRRLYYGLVGLPPSAAEIEHFQRTWDQSSEGAVAAVIERLLADPRYGERWGRHWLDVARYADTKDLVLLYGRDALRPFAYTYRDYVIRAFNENLPINQFIGDQLAADRIEPAVPPWRLAALGFLTVGRLFDNNPHDQIDDQIDTVSRGLLGLTVACARCHDHKYDAISTAEYYGLYGVFASAVRPTVLPLIEDPASVLEGPAFELKFEAARRELEAHVDTEFAALSERFRARIGDYLVRAATTPPDLTETAQFGLSLTPDDFRPSLMQRTRRFMQRRLRLDDSVFGPWARLMALPDSVFPIQPTAVAGFLSVPSSGSSPFNPEIVQFLSSRVMTNRASLPRAYGDLFWQAYSHSKTHASSQNASLKELVRLVDSSDGPLWFPRRETPDHMSRPEKDRYGGLALGLDKMAAYATNAPPARAMVLTDLPEPFQPFVFIRGSPARPGPLVPRAFPRILNGGHPKSLGPSAGRLELAQAIASPTNPLTARVFVNRVWMEHFGEPLVSTPSDFGARSDPPSNAPLLEWLAAEFIDSGWNLKHLHRILLRSATFQQASLTEDSQRSSRVIAARKVDPLNVLLWHYPRRRLDFEAMRDTLLHLSGRLQLTLGGRPVDIESDSLNGRRTVYGLVDRQNLPGLFRSFDFASPDQCVERRSQTTVPQQALFALNSDFTAEQARSLLSLPEIKATLSTEFRVNALYRRVFGRLPRSFELIAARRFLESDHSGAVTLARWETFAQALLATNEVVFLD